MNPTKFRKYQFKKLGAILNLSPERLVFIVENIDEYYKERTEKKFDSKIGDFKRYKDGTAKLRTIRPSYKDLKLAQHRIKARLLKPIELPKNVHGGTKKKSNITNAKAHQGNKYVFVTDLQDFYPSISSKMVYDCYVHQGYSSHMSSLLCKLTTWKYCLPQGAPTSTHISNLVFLNTDLRIIDYCQKHNITYTRYIDDLTFSSQQDFRDKTSKLLKFITDDGFKISYRKTQYGGRSSDSNKFIPVITGIKVHLNKIDATDRIIEKAGLEIDSPFKPVTNYLANIRKTNKHKYR